MPFANAACRRRGPGSTSTWNPRQPLRSARYKPRRRTDRPQLRGRGLLLCVRARLVGDLCSAALAVNGADGGVEVEAAAPHGVELTQRPVARVYAVQARCHIVGGLQIRLLRRDADRIDVPVDGAPGGI